MERQNSLGIYLAAGKAFVVLLSGQGQRPVRSFSVSVDPAEVSEGQKNSLGMALSQKLAGDNLNFAEVSVAIDCAMFTQHNLHSEFTDAKQIAHTVAFDAEEALATDASEMALAFSIVGSDESGSDIALFSAKRGLMTELLSDLQSAGLDPIVIEPDIVTLTRFLQKNFAVPVPYDSGAIFAVFSDKACYIITKSDLASGGRSFLVAKSQNKTDVLSSQIPLTIASQKSEKPPAALFIAGCGVEKIDTGKLADSTGLEVQSIDIVSIIAAGEDGIDDSNAAELAFAYGAAMAQVPKTQTCDFRQSFAPYLGRKLLLQKTLRFLAVCVAILLVAVGIYFQLKVFRKNNYTSRLKDKLQGDYAAVMYGKKHTSAEPFQERLKREYTKVQKKHFGGIADEEAVTAKLTFIFEVLNECPKAIDLNVETIKISSKTITISGDTNSRKNTLKMLDYFEKHSKLKTSPQKNLKSAGNRDTFTIHLEPN